MFKFISIDDSCLSKTFGHGTVRKIIIDEKLPVFERKIDVVFISAIDKRITLVTYCLSENVSETRPLSLLKIKNGSINLPENDAKFYLRRKRQVITEKNYFKNAKKY